MSSKINMMEYNTQKRKYDGVLKLIFIYKLYYMNSQLLLGLDLDLFCKKKIIFYQYKFIFIFFLYL